MMWEDNVNPNLKDVTIDHCNKQAKGVMDGNKSLSRSMRTYSLWWNIWIWSIWLSLELLNKSCYKKMKKSRIYHCHLL